MSNNAFRFVLIMLAIAGLIAFLAIVADVMTKNPAIPWFGFGILATLVFEALVYGVYRLIKYIGTRKHIIHKQDK